MVKKPTLYIGTVTTWSEEILNTAKYGFDRREPINPNAIAEENVAKILFSTDNLNIYIINNILNI